MKIRLFIRRKSQLLSYYKLPIPIYLKMKVRNYWGVNTQASFAQVLRGNSTRK